MPTQSPLKLGRFVFTVGWMLLAFAALYGKAPRFWQNSDRQPTIAGINLQPPAPQRTLPELLTPSVGGFAQADVALQARAEPVAGRNTGASRPANSRGPEHRSSSEPYSALKTREPSRQSGDDPSLAGRKSSTDGEPSTVNTRVEPATAPENARVAARAAAATGRSEAAASAYARAVAAAPLDTDLLLEAARYNASVGQAANAVALYQSYLSMRPATGLSLELTRTALAAQRPELAVEWAEAGVAGGDRGSDLQYAYAQALHLSDRPAAAAAILQKLLVGDPHNGDWLLWLAYTAQARGRSVEAYELLRAAIDAGTTPAGNLWLTRGDVAAQWGDVLRAKKDYERARSSGADPEAVSSREQKLSDQLSPQIAVPGEVLGDSNGVEFAQGAVTFFLQPTASGRFSGTWASGQISQRGYGFSTRAARVDMDDAFVSTRLQLRAGGGVQQNGDETLATWHGGGTYRFARGGSLAADAIRDTPWSRQLEANPLRFNRVIDLAALGPGFHFTKWKGRADVPLTSVDSVFAEASFSRYSDANGESELYLQYQRAKSLSRSWWAAVQPNLYLDRWSEHRTEYFSPLQHTTVGVTLKSIVERARWLVDASATPQMLQSNGQRGFGLTFATAARVNLGGVSVGGSVMLFDDRRYNYDLHRFTLDLRVPLSK